MESRVEAMAPHMLRPHQSQCHCDQLEGAAGTERGAGKAAAARGNQDCVHRTDQDTRGRAQGGTAQLTEHHQAETSDQLLFPLCSQSVALVLSSHLLRGYFGFLKAWATRHKAPSTGPSRCTADTPDSFGLYPPTLICWQIN